MAVVRVRVSREEVEYLLARSYPGMQVYRIKLYLHAHVKWIFLRNQ